MFFALHYTTYNNQITGPFSPRYHNRLAEYGFKSILEGSVPRRNKNLPRAVLFENRSRCSRNWIPRLQKKNITGLDKVKNKKRNPLRITLPI